MSEVQADTPAFEQSRQGWIALLLRILLSPKFVLAILAFSLLLTAPFLVRAYKLHGIPIVDEPFDLDAAGTVLIRPEQNAFELYRKAFDLRKPENIDNFPQKLDAALERGWKTAEPAVRKWLEDNRPALVLYLAGSDRPDSLWLQPKDYGDYASANGPPSVLASRDLFRLAQLEGLRLEYEGNLAGAWNCYRAILRSGRHYVRHGGFLDRVFGSAAMSYGLEMAQHWSELPQVDAELMRKALSNAVELRALNGPASGGLQTDYFILRNTMLGESWRGIPRSTANPDPDFQERLLDFLNAEPEVSRRVARLAWANWLSQSDRPRYLRTYEGGDGFYSLDPTLATKSNLRSGSQIAPCIERSVLMPKQVANVKRSLDAADRDSARQGLLELTLALQLFAREHRSAYPDSLAKLSPKYLKEIPADPFGRGESLRYRREVAPETGFTVWSIGPDEIDDQGKIEFGSEGAKRGDLRIRIPRPKVPNDG